MALTLKKPKENQCFWFRTLKNPRKSKENCFFFWKRYLGGKKGACGTPEDEGNGCFQKKHILVELKLELELELKLYDNHHI